MKKEYGKNRWIKGFWIFILALVCISLFWAIISNPDTETWANGGIIIIFLLCIFKVLQVFSEKIIISEDHVTIKKWVIFKEVKDIKYKKINSVDITYVLGIWGLEIQIGNDKPIVFKNLEKYDEVKEHIHSKIDQ